MWQSGHARVRLGVMTKFALLVIVGAAVIFYEFFLLLSRMHLSALHHCVLELFPISRNPPLQIREFSITVLLYNSLTPLLHFLSHVWITPRISTFEVQFCI